MTCKEIKDYLDKESGFDIAEFNRKTIYIRFRWWYYYFCFRYATDSRSYDFVGKLIGRTHATALNGLKEFYNVYSTDASFRSKTNIMDAEIKKTYSLSTPESIKMIDDMDLMMLKKTTKQLRQKLHSIKTKYPNINLN